MPSNLSNQNNKVKISVIVPVYNAEKYIEDCIGSLLSQTLAEMEFIFINDGSEDHSLSLLEKYAGHPKIKIFSQDNKGVSAARNLGIEKAQGAYVGFLDADDIHDSKFHEKLWEKTTEDVDIIVSDILMERDGKLILKKAPFSYGVRFENQHIQEEIIPYMLCIEHPTLLSVCNKIYKKKLIDAHHIRFQEEIKLEEDTLFNLMCMFHSQSLSFTDYAGYHHKDNPNSVTRDFLSNDIFEKTMKKYRMNYKDYVALNISEKELFEFQCSRLIYSVSILFFKTATHNHIDSDTKKSFLREMLMNVEVQKATQHLHISYQKKMGRLEQLIVFFIKTEKIKMALLFANLLSWTYTPTLSEIFRKFNRK